MMILSNTIADQSLDQWAMPSLVSVSEQEPEQSYEDRQKEIADAYESASRKGYEQGLLEGHQAAKDEINQAFDLLTTCQDQFEHALIHIDEGVLKSLIHLSTDLAERIVRAEIATEPSLMKTQIDASLAVLSDTSADVSVRMHPEDAQALSILMQQHAQSERLHIIEDATLKRGDCTLNTPVSFVESIIREKLEKMVAQLEAIFDQPQALGEEETAPLIEQSEKILSSEQIETSDQKAIPEGKNAECL